MASPSLSLATRKSGFLYIGMAGLAMLIVFVGFAPTFYLNGHFEHHVLTPVVILHGIAFSGWILLLVAQTSLVKLGRTDVHRKLGIAGAILAVIMVSLGVTVAIAFARRGIGTPQEGLILRYFLPFPLLAMLAFTSFVGAAIYWRRSPEVHKRLMLLATFTVLQAAISRLHLAFIARYHAPAYFVLTDMLLLASVLYDYRSQRRIHVAYMYGGALLVFSQLASMGLAHVRGWIPLARWICGA